MKVLVLFGSGYRESGEGVDFGVNDLLLTADSSDVVLSEPSSVTERGYCTAFYLFIYTILDFEKWIWSKAEKGPYCRLRRAGGTKYLPYNYLVIIRIFQLGSEPRRKILSYCI